MKRFAIKGSNTLFKVWGIIAYVFAGIIGIFGIISVITAITGTSMIEDPLSNSAYYYYENIVKITFTTIVWLIIEIVSGVVLVRNYVKSKDTFIVLAIIRFIHTFGCLYSYTFWARIGAAVFMLELLFHAAWNTATGVILIIKRSRAIPWSNESNLDSNKTYAMLEGAFGDFQSKQYRLEAGQTCKIGGEPTCDIQLNHPKISQLHCTVTLLDNGNFLITGYSSNGTFYGSTTLVNGMTAEVYPGNMLVVGEADNVIALKTYSGNAY